MRRCYHFASASAKVLLQAGANAIALGNDGQMPRFAAVEELFIITLRLHLTQDWHQN